jgi:hypothetical protein
MRARERERPISSADERSSSKYSDGSKSPLFSTNSGKTLESGDSNASLSIVATIGMCSEIALSHPSFLSKPM